ncbi:protein kinase [Tieghemostelium lacteum]|uniref:Protein kinase n=1 Tax=Tieghemostelium lacteum TaxID=361077 RepID=A0A151ZJX4_TIELA|nr:protein kinase [Tieghemostelium lacteum]|eukprot:KYQ94298.1 protein kinase [Tieghemostelium lacteum]
MGSNSSKPFNNPYISNSSFSVEEQALQPQQPQLQQSTSQQHIQTHSLSSTSSSSSSLSSTLPTSLSSSLLFDKKQKRRSKRNSSIDSKASSGHSLSPSDLQFIDEKTLQQQHQQQINETIITTTSIHNNTQNIIVENINMDSQSNSNNNVNNNNNNNNNNNIDINSTTTSDHTFIHDHNSTNSNLSISSLHIVCENCNHHITPRILTPLPSTTSTPTPPLHTTFSSSNFITPIQLPSIQLQNFNNQQLQQQQQTLQPLQPPPGNQNINLSISSTSIITPQPQRKSKEIQPDGQNNLNVLAASLGSTSDLFKNSLISNFLNQSQINTNNNNNSFTHFNNTNSNNINNINNNNNNSFSPPITPRFKDASYDSKDFLTVNITHSDQISENSSESLSNSKSSLKRFTDVLRSNNPTPTPGGTMNSTTSIELFNSINSIGTTASSKMVDDYDSKEQTFLSSFDQESVLKDKSITSNTSSSSISSSSNTRSYLTTSNSAARPRGRSISDSLFISQNAISSGINDLQKAIDNEKVKRNRYQELQALLANKENIIDVNDIQFVNKIGEGSFSEVWEGKWNGIVVAIKKLKIIGDEEQFKERFIREVQNLKNASHQNIVMFIGACYKPACIVTEYMQGGSLYNVLHYPRENKPRYSFPMVLKMTMDIALGLQHLHSISIVHRDLTSQNILLDDMGNLKISDFGLSRVKTREGSMTMTNGGICNPRWRPPEITKNVGHYSEKVDVYCFSLVVWELLTGEIPFSDLDGSQASAQVAYAGLRPILPDHCDPDLKKLLIQCWDSEPNTRPSFTVIVSKLKEIYHNNPLGFLSIGGHDSGESSSNSSNNLTSSGHHIMEAIVQVHQLNNPFKQKKITPTPTPPPPTLLE